MNDVPFSFILIIHANLPFYTLKQHANLPFHAHLPFSFLEV